VRYYPLLIIGGGLSGLAAGIRFARFGQKVLILEKHSKAGGLNSYYYRKGRLLETGLHAITNYAPPENKHAPLNRLLRQLKIPRRNLKLRQQLTSEVVFPERASLTFSNDFGLLQSQVALHFPDSIGQFNAMKDELDRYDPFSPRPKISARKFVSSFLSDKLLREMLFCPIMFYGSSDEGDMDLSQFVILFRSIFQEGLFRPEGTIKDLLGLLLQQYKDFAGEIEFSSGVEEIISTDNKITGVRTRKGEKIRCDCLISTAGLPETKRLFAAADSAAKFSELPEDNTCGRISFVESIFLLEKSASKCFSQGRTIIFYNLNENFTYRRPDKAIDLNSGVICFPDNFVGGQEDNTIQIRVTHLANYDLWLQAYNDTDKSRYQTMKIHWTGRSKNIIGKIIGNCFENIVYEDTFTPVTIERYTSRLQGAVYGSPNKVKDGKTGFDNLYIVGTDQGYLGIVGSLLSGVTMVNQHILNRI
jgi:phytoene dehydrogenase-like protein